MTRFLLLTALAASAVAAGALNGKLTHGRWLANGSPDAGLWFEVCGELYQADGGAVVPERRCEPCPDGWQSWNACEARWRLKNGLPPLKR